MMLPQVIRRGLVYHKSLYILILSAFLLCGCQTQIDLYTNLDEQQANEVMAALLGYEIPCEKKPGEENTWSITVDKSRFSEAMHILKDAGLPGRKYVGVGEAFKKSGMVSSPTEERIRYMYALSQDLSATLNEIDGVIAARVHVVLPENDPFAKVAKPASASVFIKHASNVDLEIRTPYIKNLVKDSIEGLQYEKISVVLFPTEPTITPPVAATVASPSGLDHSSAELNLTTPRLITMGVSSTLLFLGMGLLLGRWFTVRQNGSAS